MTREREGSPIKSDADSNFLVGNGRIFGYNWTSVLAD